MASVAAAVDETESPDDARSRLNRAAHGYVRFALAEPGVFSVMFRRELFDVTDPVYRAAGAASFGQLADLVAAAQGDGWQTGVPGDRLAAVLWAEVHGLAELWLHGALQSVVDVDSADALVDVYLSLRP